MRQAFGVCDGSECQNKTVNSQRLVNECFLNKTKIPTIFCYNYYLFLSMLISDRWILK